VHPDDLRRDDGPVPIEGPGVEADPGAQFDVGIVSLHTSPLAQPGAGDGGGMNVYVDALARALARAGVACTVYTRSESPEAPSRVAVAPGVVVRHLEAGPRRPLPKHALTDHVEAFGDALLEAIAADGRPPSLLHANYWLSGVAAHRAKHVLDVPLAATFHTLARVKADAEAGDDDPSVRARAEADVVRCADLVLASTLGEVDDLVRLYDADRSRIEVVPPGVDHRVFHPGSRSGARAALRAQGVDLGDGPVVLFVGRIQPLKGVRLAVRCLAELHDRSARLVIVGGPSGPDGPAELADALDLADSCGVADRVLVVPPRPHAQLADFYRAADLCLVPSRSESFGLVALEAASCGVPVVAASVGGLRTLVDDGATGFLVASRDPADYAAPIDALLVDPELAVRFGQEAVARSQRYSWDMAAARLRRLYADLALRVPVQCT
jgi:D-inositol-3-phosphate glycosyltransferase